MIAEGTQCLGSPDRGLADVSNIAQLSEDACSPPIDISVGIESARRNAGPCLLEGTARLQQAKTSNLSGENVRGQGMADRGCKQRGGATRGAGPSQRVDPPGGAGGSSRVAAGSASFSTGPDNPRAST